MSALFETLGAAGTALVSASWQVAVVALAALLIVRLCGRWLSPRWRAALWSLVLLRALVPVAPEVPGSPVPWDAGARVAALRAVDGTSIAAPERRRAGGPALVAPRAVARPEPAAAPPAPGAPGRAVSAGSTPLVAGASAPPAAAHAAPEPGGGPDLASLLGVLWVLGAGLYLGRTLRRERRFSRALAREPRADDPALLALVEECRARVGLRRGVEVVVTSLVGSPAVTGLRRAQLLLPPRVLARLDRNALTCVVLHELAHLRHRDVLRNAGLTLVTGVYWFHPFVRLAIRRLRAETETLRDREALAAHPAPDPMRYANTLIELLESSRGATETAPAVGILSSGADLKRRILMISSHDPSKRRPWILGAGLFFSLAFVAFTSSAAPASPQRGQRGAAEVEPGPDLRRVEVERHLPRAEWRVAADEQLDTVLTVEIQGADLGEVAHILRASTELDVVLAPGVEDDLGDRIFEVPGTERTLAELLDAICDRTDGNLDWGLVREALFIGFAGEIPEATDLRFYKVDELVHDEEDASELFGLVIDFATLDWGVWDSEGARVDYMGGLLVVQQTERVHAAVEAFLSRLLNEGEAPPPVRPAWSDQVEEALSRHAPVHLDGATLGEAAEQLAEVLGVPVSVDRDWRDWEVDLVLENATGANALAFLAEPLGLNVIVEEGVVHLTERERLSLEFYDVGDLWAHAEDEDHLRDQFEMLIRDDIEVDNWDLYPECSLVFWRDQMLVVQSEDAHAQIGALLEALRRALQ